MMETQLPQALLWVAEILLGKKGAFYFKQTALQGWEVLALKELMSAKDVDCTVCVSFISLHEENTDYNREKYATSSRLGV